MTRSAITWGAAIGSASRSSYVEDGPTLRGTGGAILHALPLLPSCFWVTYGDTLLDVDLAAAGAVFDTSGCRALMTVLHNRDAWQPSNALVDAGYVVDYGKSPPPAGAEHIDYGMLLFQRSSWDCRNAEEVFDLADVLRPLIRSREVAAFEVTPDSTTSARPRPCARLRPSCPALPLAPDDPATRIRNHRGGRAGSTA